MGPKLEIKHLLTYLLIRSNKRNVLNIKLNGKNNTINPISSDSHPSATAIKQSNIQPQKSGWGYKSSGTPYNFDNV